MTSLVRGSALHTVLGACVLVLVLPLLTTRGRVGGDELDVYLRMVEFQSSGAGLWEFISTFSYGDFIFRHRLVWFLEQVTVVEAYARLTAWFGGQTKPVVREFLVAYSHTLLVWTAVLLSAAYIWKHSGVRKWHTVLLVYLVWFGGCGLFFLTGNFVECGMALLVVLRLVTVRAAQPIGRSRMAALVAIDCILIAIKPYSVVFCILTLPSFWPDGKERARFLGTYAFGLTLVLTPWMFMNGASGSVAVYSSLPWSLSPVTIGERLVHSLLSPAFGVIWAFPALAFAAFSGKGCLRPLAVKGVALLSCLLIFCSLPFWHGQVAGNRYLFPFLLFLLPEISRGFLRLLRAQPKFAWVVPALTLAFGPSIEFRNTAVMEYSEGTVLSHRGDPSLAPSGTVSQPDRSLRSRIFSDELPLLYDPSFHPAIFAWRVTLGKWIGAKEFRLANSLQDEVEMRAVYPMTAVSRVIFLLAERPKIGTDAIHVLEEAGLGSVVLWEVFRAILVSIYLALVTVACIHATRSPLASHDSFP